MLGWNNFFLLCYKVKYSRECWLDKTSEGDEGKSNKVWSSAGQVLKSRRGKIIIWTQRYIKYFTDLFFLVHTVSYRTCFFCSDLWHSCLGNKSDKKTWSYRTDPKVILLVRGICTVAHWILYECMVWYGCVFLVTLTGITSFSKYTFLFLQSESCQSKSKPHSGSWGYGKTKWRT